MYWEAYVAQPRVRARRLDMQENRFKHVKTILKRHIANKSQAQVQIYDKLQKQGTTLDRGPTYLRKYMRPIPNREYLHRAHHP